MTTTPPRIDPRLGAAALRAPAASKEDSRPQAILKFQPRNSFDYRVRYEPQLMWFYLHGIVFVRLITIACQKEQSSSSARLKGRSILYPISKSKSTYK